MVTKTLLHWGRISAHTQTIRQSSQQCKRVWCAWRLLRVASIREGPQSVPKLPLCSARDAAAKRANTHARCMRLIWSHWMRSACLSHSKCIYFTAQQPHNDANASNPLKKVVRGLSTKSNLVCAQTHTGSSASTASGPPSERWVTYRMTGHWYSSSGL